MRILATAWSAFSISETVKLKIKLDNLIVDPDTPCYADLFPGFFKMKLTFQVCPLSFDFVLHINGL